MTFKSISWFLFALFWINIIVVAKVGRRVKNYKGFNSTLYVTCLTAHIEAIANTRQISYGETEEITKEEDEYENKIFIRGP